MKGFNLRLSVLALFVLLLQGTIFSQSFTVPGTFSGRPNAASSLGGNCWEITPNQTNRAGAIWSSTPLDLSNPFDLTLHTTLAPWGADGMAFVLQTLGPTYVGQGGNALGFANNTNNNTGGVSPSFAVELDIWDSRPALANDIAEDHLAIVVNANHAAPIFGPTQARASGADITDGICRPWRMVWNPVTDNFQVWFDGVQIFNVTYDIPTQVFGGTTTVTWGVTGSTGGAASRQTICYEFADAGSDTASCAGSPLQLNATGGNNYIWWNQLGSGFSFNNQNIANPLYTPLPAPNPQFVRVTVNNSLGCTDRDTISIAIDPAPTPATAGPDQTLCGSNSTTLAGNTPSVGIGQWNLLSGAGTLANPAAGNSGVTNLGTGANVFEWTITNTSACPVERDTVVIFYDPAPTIANAGPDQTLCGVTSINLAGNTATSGTGGWTQLSGSGTIVSPGNPTTFVNNLGQGSYTFEWAISTGPACPTSRDTVTIVIWDAPSVSMAGIDQTVCSSEIVQLGANTPTVGTGQWSFATGSGNLSSTTDPNATLSNLPGSGLITLVWTISNGTCPPETDQVDITVLPAPTVDILTPDTTICFSDEFRIRVDSTGNTNITWNPTTGLNPSTSLTPLVSPAADTRYFLTVTDPVTNCSVTDSINVLVNALPIDSIITLDTFICNVDTVQLDVSSVGGAATYAWAPSTGLSNSGIGNPSAFPTATTTYTVAITETATGCTRFDSIDVEVFSLSIADFADTTLCEGDFLDLEIATGDLFFWTSTDPAVDGSTADSIRIMPTTAQDYSVLVIGNFGSNTCSDSAAFRVEVNSVTATAAPDYSIINPGQSVDLTSDGDLSGVPYTFSWSPVEGLDCDTCSNPIATPGETTTYTVTVTDTAGCFDTYDVTIEVDEFLVPNVFTPNNDGINDELFINYYGTREYETKIYDRWGKLVFETKDKEVLWNGKIMNSNANCPTGTYFMVLYIINDDSIPEELKNKGFEVSLLR